MGYWLTLAWWLRCGVLVLGVWSAAGASAMEHMLEIQSARASVTVVGQPVVHSEVTLPYRWDKLHGGQQGDAVFDMTFDLAQPPQGVWGIYLPRLGNGYAIWLNGELLQQQGQLPAHAADTVVFNSDDFARIPRFIPVGEGHFRSSNHLRIHIRADVGRRGGLSRVWIGPQEQTYARYVQDYRWRVTGSVLVAAVSLVVGLTAWIFWLAQRREGARAGTWRRDPLYLFAAVAQLFWAVYVSDVMVESPPVAWPWWGILQVIALGTWACSMVMACMELAGWRGTRAGRLLLRWFLVLMLLCPLSAGLALAYGVSVVLTVWYLAIGVTLLGFALALLHHAWQEPGLELRVVAMAALLNAMVALRDIYVFRFVPAYADNSLLRYASLGFALALGFIIFTRFRATSAQLNNLLDTLASRVSERENDLRASYGRLEALAREQERTAERSRILRNMHDGVGAHLSSAIRQLQAVGSENLADTRTEVLGTLQDALDHLKLNIDAMHLTPGDVTALLANLRYRLEPRFTAMGIALQWDVDLLPPCNLDANAMRELQFILFEAFSNVLQHSHARMLRIEGHVRDGQVVLRVMDDGVGFDATTDARRGLGTMRERALSIAAQVHIQSVPGRTQVEITLGSVGA